MSTCCPEALGPLGSPPKATWTQSWAHCSSRCWARGIFPSQPFYDSVHSSVKNVNSPAPPDLTSCLTLSSSSSCCSGICSSSWHSLSSSLTTTFSSWISSWTSSRPSRSSWICSSLTSASLTPQSSSSYDCCGDLEVGEKGQRTKTRCYESRDTIGCLPR